MANQHLIPEQLMNKPIFSSTFKRLRGIGCERMRNLLRFLVPFSDLVIELYIEFF